MVSKGEAEQHDDGTMMRCGTQGSFAFGVSFMVATHLAKLNDDMIF